MAIYQTIADSIKLDIEKGRLKPGDKLASLSQMRAVYRVSDDTLRSALLVLKTEGWVYGHQGLGVFVVDPADR